MPTATFPEIFNGLLFRSIVFTWEFCVFHVQITSTIAS